MFIFAKFLLAASFFLMTDREDLWTPDFIGDQTEEVVDGVAAPVHFENVKDQRVLLLVHGYNNTAQEALDTYQAVRQRMEDLQLYDAIIGYLWPGCDEKLEYFEARDNTKQLASRVKSNLQALVQNAAHLDVLAHSMGNRLILEALRLSPQLKTLIRNFYSLAPAVKEKSIEVGHPFYSSALQCQKMFVFHSEEDDVLKYSFPVAEQGTALGYEGCDESDKEPKNVQFVDCTEFVDGHSAYFTAQPVYDFFKNQQAFKTLDAMDVKLLADGLVSQK